MVNREEASGDLDTALEEIHRLMHDVREDLKSGGFDRHMESDDLLGILLRAHLWIERALKAVIERSLKHPERLRARWSFRHRLELVAALGFLDEVDLQAYLYLDDLRNRVAHRFNYTVSEGDQAAMISRLQPSLRGSIEASTVGKPFPEPLRQALRLLVVTLMLRLKGMGIDVIGNPHDGQRGEGARSE